MRELGGGQHRVIDTEVIDALTYAWLARSRARALDRGAPG